MRASIFQVNICPLFASNSISKLNGLKGPPPNVIFYNFSPQNKKRKPEKDISEYCYDLFRDQVDDGNYTQNCLLHLADK